MRLVVVVLVASLVGCLGASPRPATDGTGPSIPPHVANEMTGCREAAFVMFVPFATLEAALPEGYVAEDASVFIPAPVPMGKGLVYVNTVTCVASTLDPEGGAVSEPAIFVKHPDVAGVEPAAFNFYAPTYYAPDGGFLDAVVATGWPARAAQVALEVSDLPTPGATAEGHVADADGEVFTFRITAPGPDPRDPRLEGQGRFWRDLPEGTAYVDYVVSTAVAKGGAECSIAVGSELASLTGMTSCDASSSAGAVLLGFDADSGIHFLAGVHAAP